MIIVDKNSTCLVEKSGPHAVSATHTVDVMAMLGRCRERLSRGAYSQAMSRGWEPLFAGLLAVGLFTLSVVASAEPISSELVAMKAQYQRPTTIPSLPSNPFSAAKMALGQQLFFDRRLSGPATMSCATCHNPALSWSDALPTGIGAAGNHSVRHTPTLLNLAWAEIFFWDGRADSLESQAIEPIQNADEMNMPMPRLVATLRAIRGYRVAFDTAFPGEPISDSTIAKAIATFERGIVSGEAPFDRWIAGDDGAINESAKRGFVTFNTAAHCSACHSGWRFTDDSFQDIGLSDGDLGRGQIVEGVDALHHAFKTPGLRNIALRAPYMHNGSFATLTEVLNHYSNGFVRRPSLSPEIHRLSLTDQDVEDLVAFLKTLTSLDTTVVAPALPISETK